MKWLHRKFDYFFPGAVGNGTHFYDTTKWGPRIRGRFPKVSQKWLDQLSVINHNPAFLGGFRHFSHLWVWANFSWLHQTLGSFWPVRSSGSVEVGPGPHVLRPQRHGEDAHGQRPGRPPPEARAAGAWAPKEATTRELRRQPEVSGKARLIFGRFPSFGLPENPPTEAPQTSNQTKKRMCLYRHRNNII